MRFYWKCWLFGHKWEQGLFRVFCIKCGISLRNAINSKGKV